MRNKSGMTGEIKALDPQKDREVHIPGRGIPLKPCHRVGCVFVCVCRGVWVCACVHARVFGCVCVVRNALLTAAHTESCIPLLHILKHDRSLSRVRKLLKYLSSFPPASTKKENTPICSLFLCRGIISLFETITFLNCQQLKLKHFLIVFIN